ncbi:hypothetical protein M2132_001912 [Dysgonomonas sp. PH5-45]|uniref:hypothetical protein n=1 Tax=unclassified Dysgonomonas TaxID=2630389 RepID=UPI002474AC4F|nr:MULTISPECIES: hypothetical protein [unclassified Dysgonomonas]MDH6355567.1 hypothetical protein [Dysgonomonas sp. PH5-45]MDH6388464.1 hypothetical protein [Dysgonomonas sp. PH5-37]
MKKFIYILLVAFAVSSCMVTQTVDPNKLTMGMSKSEVAYRIGNPERVLAINSTPEGYQEVLQYRSYDNEVFALEFWDDYLTGYEFLYDDNAYIARPMPSIRPPMGAPLIVGGHYHNNYHNNGHNDNSHNSNYNNGSNKEHDYYSSGSSSNRPNNNNQSGNRKPDRNNNNKDKNNNSGSNNSGRQPSGRPANTGGRTSTSSDTKRKTEVNDNKNRGNSTRTKSESSSNSSRKDNSSSSRTNRTR